MHSVVITHTLDVAASEALEPAVRSPGEPAVEARHRAQPEVGPDGLGGALDAPAERHGGIGNGSHRRTSHVLNVAPNRAMASSSIHSEGHASANSRAASPAAVCDVSSITR